MANRTPGVTEKLTEQAMQEFLANGYRNASLRTIAENASTSPRAVYTRYGDKEGLFAALVSEQAETLKAMFRRYMPKAEALTYIGQLQAFFACGWDHLFRP